jgi:hypothetical protein
MNAACGNALNEGSKHHGETHLEDQPCTFSGEPCVKGPVINCGKEEKANSNSVKLYYSKSF